MPIGGLAGLIGLGGGEFRLPVLMHGIGFDAKSAMPLNLMISLVTLSFAVLSRSGTVSLTTIVPYLPELVGLAVGGMVSAVYGVRLVRRLTGDHLVWLIALLLVGIGALLLWEAAFPFQFALRCPPRRAHLHRDCDRRWHRFGEQHSRRGRWRAVDSDTDFHFRSDIRTAGSASILISLGIVVIGLWRYWRLNAIPHGRGIQRITFAMSVGSIIGATVGGFAVAYAPVVFLKSCYLGAF